MKAKSLFIIALSAAVPALACAKKPKVAAPEPVQEEQQVVEEGEDPVITEECVINVSLFNESVKNKQYADAYGPWYEVYTTCPNANKAIYSQGAKILDWKYSNATTEEEKNEIRNMIMQMHDKRIRFFGNDPKYPKAYILGQKALDYCQYFPEDELKEKAYGWLKQSVEGMGAKSQILVLSKYAELSYGLYKSNPDKYGEQFINDYQLASSHLATLSSDPTNKNASAAASQKDYVDNLFAVSGAADCSKLDEIYAPVVEANKENLDMLLKIAKLYQRVKCTESEAYFAACAYSHQLQPTEESAAGCARMAMKKGDYRQAIDYFDQAIVLADQDEDLEDSPEEYLYSIAYIYYDKLKNYPQSRTYARRSLDRVANQGRCYILIGLCYASSQPYAAPEYPAAKAAILNKSVFWAAVDKCQQAKRVDPTVTEAADKMIAQFSKYFPTKEEMFDLPGEFGGATFTVGGWINESTVCRPAK